MLPKLVDTMVKAPNKTVLARVLVNLIESTETTLVDLLEFVRISKTEFVIEQAALTLYVITKRPRKAPECDTNFASWIKYLNHNPDAVPEYDRECWLKYFASKPC